MIFPKLQQLSIVSWWIVVLRLCWFIDGSVSDSQWELYRLSNPRELMVDAAEEFDKLLRSKP